MAGTVRDAMTQMLMQQLGQISPVLPLLLNFPGLNLPERLLKDPVFDQVVNLPGMSPFGTMSSYLSSSRQSAITKAFGTDGPYGGLSNFGQQYRSALTAILGNEGQADALMRNPIASGLISYLDPMKVHEGVNVMAKTIDTASRMYGYRTLNGTPDYGALAAYPRALYQMYTGNEGLMKAIAAAPGEFGNLSYKQIMDVAAETLSIEDPLADIKNLANMSESDVQDKAKAFSKKVKDLSKAVAPLQELFGQDIPKLFSALEKITGNNSIFTDPNRVKAVVNNIQATLDVTGASAQQYMSTLDVFQKGLTMPGSNSRAILGANAATQNFLLSTAGVKLVGITGMEFQQAAAKFQMGTMKSSFADQYNQAYSLYMNESKEENKSEAAFRARVQALTDAGVDGQTAIMRALGQSGVQLNSVLDLSRGRRYETYIRANEAGYGGTLSQASAIRTIFRDAINTAKDDETRSRLMAIRDAGDAAMGEFLAQGYQAKNRQTAEDWNHVYQLAQATLPGTEAELVAYGRSFQKGLVMKAQQEKRVQMVNALNGLTYVSGIGGILEAMREKGTGTDVVRALAGFFGGIDQQALDSGMMTTLFSNLTGKDGLTKEEQASFMKMFNSALKESATWSQERIKKYQNVLRDKKGQLRDVAGVRKALTEYNEFVDLEAANTKLIEIYGGDNKASQDARAKLVDAYKKRGKDDSVTNITGDAVARALLETNTKNVGEEERKILTAAIEKDKSGTGAGIYSAMRKAQQDEIDKVTKDKNLSDKEKEKSIEGINKRYADAEKAFDDTLSPTMGGASIADKFMTFLSTVGVKVHWDPNAPK